MVNYKERGTAAEHKSADERRSPEGFTDAEAAENPSRPRAQEAQLRNLNQQMCDSAGKDLQTRKRPEILPDPRALEVQLRNL